MTINVQFANAAVNTKDLLDPSVMNQSGLPQAELKTTIMRIINIILGFLGIIAIIIIVIGGFKWMTCGGSEEKTKEAREVIVAGIIGLIIILAAYAIANFVIDQYLGAMNK
jgi:type IV secretory pathway VirB2 component (pilin)